jgi:hypothetical protein
MMKRSEIREKFGIDGDGTSDCCVSYWVCYFFFFFALPEGKPSR